jgi:hypothetical protein
MAGPGETAMGIQSFFGCNLLILPWLRKSETNKNRSSKDHHTARRSEHSTRSVPRASGYVQTAFSATGNRVKSQIPRTGHKGHFPRPILGLWRSGEILRPWLRRNKCTLSVAMRELTNLMETQPLDTVISLYNPKDVTLKPFAFVLNVSHLRDNSAVAIAPAHMLRRATKEEVKFTKKLIASLFGQHFGPELWEDRRPKTSSGKYVQLLEKQWRYFVIEFSSDNENPELLEEVLAIDPNDLEIGFTLSTVLSKPDQ